MGIYLFFQHFVIGQTASSYIAIKAHGPREGFMSEKLSFRKNRALFISVIIIILILSASITIRFLFTDSLAFNRFTELYCRQLLSQDTLSLHYTLADPKARGISCDTVTLGNFPSADDTSARASLENQSALLSAFDPDHLSGEQALILNIMSWQNSLEKKLQDGCIFLEQPSSSLGIQAQLPILLAEYEFRCREDIDTYFLLLEDTDRYLGEYLSWQQEKIAQGIIPAAETLDSLIDQCREFLGEESPEHFLQTVFVSRCRDCDFLSEKEQISLEDQHFSLLTDHVFAAYHTLISGFQAMQDEAGSLTGLCGYPGGRDYYEACVQYICGTDLSLEEIRLRLYTQLISDIQAVRQLDLAALNSSSTYDRMDAADMVTELSERITSCFPEGPKVSWILKEVSPELSSYASPAFYMVPPTDDLTENTIYLNPQNELSGFSLYTTLAHEGFPGHLYQNTYYYSRRPPLIRRLLSFGGYTEGWATYTESLICELSGKTWDGAKFYWLDRSLNLCIASLLDIGIHGEGWDIDKTLSFLADIGITDAAAGKELYQYIVENPGNYLRYYLGCLSFLDLRAECKEELRDDFSLTEFHRAVLEAGPCPFPILRVQVKNSLGIAEDA